MTAELVASNFKRTLVTITPRRQPRSRDLHAISLSSPHEQVRF
jgi:hypothetical protein